MREQTWANGGGQSEWKERVWMVRASDGRMSAEPATLSKLRRGLDLGKLTEDMSIARQGEDDWENIKVVLDRVAKRIARPTATANDSLELPSFSVPPSVVVDRTPAPPVVTSAPMLPASSSQALRALAPHRVASSQVSALGALFDFSFTSYVTTRFIKVIYAFQVAFAGLWFAVWSVAGVGAIVGGVSTLTTDSASFLSGTAGGVVSCFIGLGGAVFFLVSGRVFLECIAVAFRILETLNEINAKTR